MSSAAIRISTLAVLLAAAAALAQPCRKVVNRHSFRHGSI